MIKSFTITNYLGDTIELELTRPDLSGFIVESVEGLGPVKANINQTESAMTDGTLYNSSYLDVRSIIMNLKFYRLPNEAIEDIRQKSYKYFPIKRKINILVKTDNREIEAVGYVESNEPDIFSAQEGCAITILCTDPFFYSTVMDETVFSGVEPMFEFPFENESLTEPLLEMGLIKNKTEETVYYRGDSEIGITIIVHAIGTASNLTIYNTLTREQMKLDSSKLVALTGSDIMPGDTITINTLKGNKSVSLLRNGKTVNILNCLVKGSDWFTLSKGDNVFVYTTDEGSNNLQFTIRHKIIYDGV